MPPTRQDLTQGHFIVGVQGEGGCKWAKTHVQLVNVGHRITRCNVNLCQSIITYSSSTLVPNKYLIEVYVFMGGLVGWLVGFYGISTFVGYLMPNPFLYKYSVLFQTIQLSMSTQFNCQKHFHFKQFSLFKQF